MTDLLLDKLPCEWAGRPIDADFRPMVWLNGQALRRPESEFAQLAQEAMQRFYRIPIPLAESEAAFKALMEFYTAGGREAPERSDCSSRHTDELALDYVIDAPVIVAAFQQAYGLDLTTQRVHWWRFKALLSSLPEETLMAKIMGYRTMDLSKLDGEMRERYAELKEQFALPGNLRRGGRQIVTLQDRDAAFAARFRR